MTTPARSDPERLHTFAALLRAWVLACAGWLAAFEDGLPPAWRRALAELVTEFENDARRLVMHLALAHLPPVVAPPRRARRPRSTPRGFRRTRDRRGLREWRRGVRVTDIHGRRGGLGARIARLRLLLARLGRHVAAPPI